MPEGTGAALGAGEHPLDKFIVDGTVKTWSKALNFPAAAVSALGKRQPSSNV